MRQLASESMARVVMTHEMDLARDVADRVAFMVDGAVAQDGKPEVVLTNPRSPRMGKFLQSILNRNGRDEDDETDGSN